MAEATTRREKLKAVQQAVQARKAAQTAGGAPRNVELERAILRNPRARGPWQVYADWLQSQGDLRGELAALVQRKPELVDDFVGKHWKTLFGPSAALFNDYTATVEEWRPGFVGHLRVALVPDNEVQHDLVEVTRRLIQLPICSLLDELSLECDPEQWAAALDHVVRAPQGSFLRRLELSSPAEGWLDGGDLSGALTKLPALEVLRVNGSGCKLGTLGLPQLREFVRTGGPLSGSEIRSLTRAELPKLERVEISIERAEDADEPDEGESPDGLLEALVSRATLRELTLNGYFFDDALTEVLLESECMPKLKLLDLSGCSIDPEAIGVLGEELELLREVPKLKLPGDVAELLELDPPADDEEDEDEDDESED